MASGTVTQVRGWHRSRRAGLLTVAAIGLLAAGLSLPVSSPTFAVEPDEILSDPGLEARARDLSAGLRCLVCQNQSIDDSSAPLARDLRLIVRERLKAGDSNVQVREFLVARYGDFVLLKPPVRGSTLLLWLTPLLVLVAAGVLIARSWRRPRTGRALAREAPLSDEETRRLAELLSDEETAPGQRS